MRFFFHKWEINGEKIHTYAKDLGHMENLLTYSSIYMDFITLIVFYAPPPHFFKEIFLSIS